MIADNNGQVVLGFRCRLGPMGWRKLGYSKDVSTIWSVKGRKVMDLEDVLMASYPNVRQVGLCHGALLERSGENGASANEGGSLEEEVRDDFESGRIVELSRWLATTNDIKTIYPIMLRILIQNMFHAISSLCKGIESRATSEDFMSSELVDDFRKTNTVSNCLSCLHAMYLNSTPGVALYAEAALPAVLSAMLAPCITIDDHIRQQAKEVLRLLLPSLSEEAERRTVRTLVRAYFQGRPRSVQGALMGLKVMRAEVAREVGGALQSAISDKNKKTGTIRRDIDLQERLSTDGIVL